MDETQYSIDDMLGIWAESGNSIVDAAEWHHDLVERSDTVQADNLTSFREPPTHPKAEETLQRLEESWPFKEDYACFGGNYLMGIACEHDQNLLEQRPTFNDAEASYICPSKINVSPNSSFNSSENNEIIGGSQPGCGENVKMEMITPMPRNLAMNTRSTRSRVGQNRRPCDLK
jgi:hypothetical protein